MLGILLTGISKSGFANGAGVVAVPLIALVAPISQALSIMLPLLILMDVQTIRYYKQHLDRKLLFRLLPAAILGITLGGFLLGSISDQLLLPILCVLCIVFSVWQPVLKRIHILHKSGPFWGILSGLTSTLIHSGGPPINAYLVTLGLDKLRWLATAGAFFASMNVIKIIPYTLAGTWEPELFVVTLIFIPLAWLGIWLGRSIQQRISNERFSQFCRILLFVSGSMLGIKFLLSL